MFGLGSHKDGFFEMFDKLAENVHEAAKALLDLLEYCEDVPNKVRRGVGRKIIFAWVVTFPICILGGALMCMLLKAVGIQ